MINQWDSGVHRKLSGETDKGRELKTHSSGKLLEKVSVYISLTRINSSSSPHPLFLPGGRFASAVHQPHQPSLSVSHCDLKWHRSVDRQLRKKEQQRPELRSPQRVHNIQVSAALTSTAHKFPRWWNCIALLKLWPARMLRVFSPVVLTSFMLSKLFVSFTYSEVVSQSPPNLLYYKITHISSKWTCCITALPNKKSNWVDFFHATKTGNPSVTCCFLTFL